MMTAKQSLRPANARMDEQIRAVLTPEQITRLDKKKNRRGCRKGEKVETEAGTARQQPVIPGIE